MQVLIQGADRFGYDLDEENEEHGAAVLKLDSLTRSHLSLSLSLSLFLSLTHTVY